jgi:type I restriction enzyme S subunit
MSGQGWLSATLGDNEIACTASGGTPDRSHPEYFGGQIPWVKSGELNDTRIFATEESLTNLGLEQSSARVFPHGTLLIALYGATAGKTGILDIDASTNQAVCAIFPRNGSFESEFLQYQLIHLRPKILNARTGGAQPNISQRVLATLEVLLPPLPEQRAIVRVLQTVQNAKEARQRELSLERERKSALMEHLFTRGTRGGATKQTPIGEVPESWGLATLESLYETQLGKMLSQKAHRGANPKPYLRNANVQWGAVDVTDLYEMDFSEAEQKKFLLKQGDLLICEGGEIGRTALWKAELPECYFQKAIHRARPRSTDVVPEFLRYWMEWGFRLADVYGVTGTQTTIAHLPQEKLAQLKIPNPPKSVQEEIATALSASDTVICAVQDEIALLDEFFAAILQGLMTGDLRCDALLNGVRIQ